ncbi:putative lipoprotein [Streptomyces sp. Tu6071]|uniref:DUF4232 domain-containing protein n=1 Tax=Streptomyces evansiae TaxID=3075535 RepID=A0ABD5E592_9ACTN|nr:MULTISPECIES: DUF4232 domain-containing protein [unclassified Streptomyces]ASY32379.1 hypothetical protein CAC01_06390 [Streptomyces sp. CLI2509]EGJ74197.1 putative lipoprotein [Streptomyces sp. Tu6071]MDT0416480.1 DUF4232 domain-containing protein [Streptomyces sp. DSM 41982]MYX20966.1 DUF4232 domain-containing protein [Streptomyces sp. SID8380]
MHRRTPLRPAAARPVPLLALLAATAALLTACGAEDAGSATAGAPAAAFSRTSVDDPGKDGVRVTSLTLPRPSPSPSPSRSRSVSAESLDLGGDSGISAAYEIINHGTETLTYTVTITFTSGDGGAMANETTTVPGVRPGKTVRGRVGAGTLPPTTPRITGAKVTEVAEVPAAEAQGADGTCPSSGVRVSTDKGDAAMGLRVVGLHLVNCGKREYEVEGYPELELLDETREPIDGVRVLRGSREITSAIEGDGPPRPVTLKPGETARADLVWRNTTDLGTPVTAPYARVRAKSGAAPVTLPEHIDLGTTGKLGVTPWVKTDR